MVLAVCWNTSLCNAEPRKITEAEKNFCAEACHKYCGEYNCIEALIDAGDVSRGEVESRRKSGK